MQICSDRILLIVASLRNFSLLDHAEMKPVNIHEGLDNTLLILQHRFKANSSFPAIGIEKHYGELPEIVCYAGQLNQVFMNIISNAVDALESVCRSKDNGEFSSDQFDSNGFGEHFSDGTFDPVKAGSTGAKRVEGRGGELSVRAMIASPTGSSPKVTITTEPTEGDRVQIRIRDNGSGIEPEVVAKLFDPFFTTKPVGQGTGLGLSISYQIVVEKHRGQLTCKSETGKGTEFCIEIPIEQPEWSEST